MKFIVLFLSLFSFSSWSCIGEVTYIDFHKAKNNIEVSGNNFIIRHIIPLKFVTKMDVEIKPKEVGLLDPPGGLVLYYINSKNMSEISGKIIATEISEQKKEISIMLTLKAPQKGSCSKTELKYN